MGAKHVVLSDYNEKVLEYAMKNIQSNNVTNASVLRLDWNEVCDETNQKNLETYDLIVGSEVCYDEFHPPIIATVVDRLLASETRTDFTPMFLVAALQTRHGINLLERCMEEVGFYLSFKREFVFLSNRSSNRETYHYIFGFCRKKS